MQDSDLIYKILKKYFNFSDFRGDQLSVIQGILEGQDSLVIMPTGFGKSLCYQLPAAIFQDSKGPNHQLVLVISPLVALMDDQVKQARSKGLKASAIHSGKSSKDKSKTMADLSENRLNLLYVTPERFQKSEFCEVIDRTKVSLLAVDEAHCISLWGHDFRPDYSKLGEIRTRLGSPTTLALTATATAAVQQDILNQLNIPKAKKFLGGLLRPELSLHVHDLVSLEDKVEKIIELRQQIKGPIIVYWSLIGTLEKALAAIRRKGLNVSKYHGQMSPQDRRQSQDDFYISDEAMLFATSAFGLGIDKSNIRGVIHGEMPLALESYYQEVGRAGRDRLPAQGHLLFDEDDVSISMDFIKWSCPEPNFVYSVYRTIQECPNEYQAEGADFLRKKLNFYNSRDFRVETSLNQLSSAGCIEWTGKFYTPLQFWNEDFFSVDLHQKHLRNQNEKLLSMLRWAQQTEGCRMQTIYSYFGEDHHSPCGICDLCK